MKITLTKLFLKLFFIGFIPWFMGCKKSLENPEISVNYLKLIDITTSKPIEGASMYYVTCLRSNGEFQGCGEYSQPSFLGKTDSNGLIKDINGPGEISFKHPDYLDYYYGYEGIQYNCKNQKGGDGYLPPRTYALYPSADVKYIIHGSNKYSTTDFYMIYAYSSFEIGKNPYTGQVEYCTKPADGAYSMINSFPLSRDTILRYKSVADKEAGLRIKYYIGVTSFWREYKFVTQKGRETVVEIPAP